MVKLGHFYFEGSFYYSCDATHDSMILWVLPEKCRWFQILWGQSTTLPSTAKNRHPL